MQILTFLEQSSRASDG